ncbi:unnamed protein product [Ectocarpus sp. CCAP 1310/34]|nr:unnamed protein product [Ectocarpus sp. CCAP 1310/34]
MTRVRGDNELLELLGIMGGDNGEQDAKTPAETSRDTRTHPAPAAGEFACVPETGWNSSIWNPHVFEPAAAATGFGVASRTGEGVRRVVSPQEEVLRQQAVAIVFSRFQARRKTRGACDSCLLPATPTAVAGGLFRLLRELGGQGGGAKDREIPGNPCVVLRAQGLMIYASLCNAHNGRGTLAFQTPRPSSGSLTPAVTAVAFVPPEHGVLPHASPAMQVLGKELGIRVKNEMFERWQFSRKLKEGRGGDPILPAESFFDPGLDAELQALGVHKAQSRNLCCELGRASKSALKTLKKQVAASMPVWLLRMNSAHYDKMKELFSRSRVEGAARWQSSSTEHPPPAWIGDFHDCLFSCLMRYEALQASMGGDAFDVLLKRFGARMECFASPFNCRYSRYCSAFPDTDGPFGRCGRNAFPTACWKQQCVSFLLSPPTEGAYQANPPFVRDVILKMATHMDGLLQTSVGHNAAVVEYCTLKEGPLSYRPMAKPKGRRQPTGGVVGRPSKSDKRAKTAAARGPLAQERLQAELEQQRAALAADRAEMAQREQALRAKEAAFAKKEQEMARAAAQREKREQQEVERVQAAAAAAAEKVAQGLDYMDTSVHEVKPKKGEVWTQLQSRMVLMLLFDLRKEGCSENEAVLQADVFFKYSS